MNIHIEEEGAKIDQKTRAVFETRIGLILGRFSKRIARVTVFILDADELPGGGRKCRMEVFLRPQRKLVVEDTDADLDVAIDRASAQMSRSVDRQLRRERAFDKEVAWF